MRLRVEELALSADVSVDTVRYYQKQRLLPPPERDGRLAWYGDEHVERIARIKELQRRGFSLAVIRRFLDGELDPADERLAAAVVEAGEAGEEELFGLDELSARTQVPQPMLEALVRDGLIVARLHEGELRFTEADVAIVAAGLRMLETGLPLPELLALARRHHAATREFAMEAVELFDTYVRRPLRQAGLPEPDRAERLVEAFRTLLPAVTDLAAHHFKRVLLQVAQEHIESVTEPALRSVTEPALRSDTEPALRSGTEPALRSGTEPAPLP
ncbi:MAG TPA: MerR family transcriptional regulator [Acidimicrobiales bacterium]|nr:MerR family transcriptional regulator [Acidimicrobiales bacterium]